MLLAFFFVLGLIIGSFLNVVILRTNTGETLKGRSRCFSCLRKLEWIDLLPVLSFLSVKGRCRYCGSKISLQYPLVELLTGIVFASSAYFFFGNVPYIVFDVLFVRYILVITFFSVLIAMSIYDARHKIIPDQYSLILLAIAVLFEGLRLAEGVGARAIFQDIFSGLGAFAFFGGLWFVSQGRWMGFGDAKLSFSLGLLLGYPGIFIAVLLAFWIGAFFGIIMLIKGVYGRKTEVPFGPFLALGTYLAFIIISSNALDIFLGIS